MKNQKPWLQFPLRWLRLPCDRPSCNENLLNDTAILLAHDAIVLSAIDIRSLTLPLQHPH